MANSAEVAGEQREADSPMIDIANLAAEQIRQRALRAVVREVGHAGLAIFLAEGGPKSGDYTAERDPNCSEFETMEEFLDAIKREGDPAKIRAELFGDETDSTAPGAKVEG